MHYPSSESSKIHSGLYLTGLRPAGAYTTIINIIVISLCTQLISYLLISKFSKPKISSTPRERQPSESTF